MQKFVLGAVLAIIGLTLYTLVDIITSSGTEKESPQSAAVSEQAAVRAEPKPKPRYTLKEKKQRFIEQILPAVRKVKSQLDGEYAKAKKLSTTDPLTEDEAAWLRQKMAQYNVSGMPCLLRRMHTHPVSLVIAQAALETGWGSSRFFNEANNVFGIWSYHSDEPRIPASRTREGKTIYVKKFDTLSDGIRGYFSMISGGYAYSSFRKARLRTDNPFELLRYLRHYSELRDEYVARLYYVMKANKLYRYDDPSYRPIALASIVPEYVAQKREEAERKQESEAHQMLALDEVKIESHPSEEEAARPCEEEEMVQEENATQEVSMLSSP
jgi:Bax protein